MSRMMPPPSAVTIPSVTTPTTSSFATRIAVKAPLRAKANVPVRSNTRNSGGHSAHRTCGAVIAETRDIAATASSAL